MNRFDFETDTVENLFDLRAVKAILSYKQSDFDFMTYV